MEILCAQSLGAPWGPGLGLEPQTYAHRLPLLQGWAAEAASHGLAVGTLAATPAAPLPRSYSWCVSPFGGRTRVEMIRS